ncbi:hypothetical protein QNI19_25695 [Cytophagaceae bacterium DM2B3-1]|uniref:Anti-sigma factor n=1 Tax=Xanthocytophaga flava TaxID=3048013 RepID=A0ABT7CTT0_9BACT|nr:hypothetical protein [Xanthocytophaga flavus]MDJ1496357.1 hypothetical protein [Xanthocytophaga flavus]
MDSENNIERIERYLLNQLSEQERIVLEQQMHADEVFRKEVEAQRWAMTQARQLGREQLRLKLNSIHQQMDTNTNKPSTKPTPAPSIQPTWMKYWPVAAAVAALVVVLGVIYTTRTSDEITSDPKPELVMVPVQNTIGSGYAGTDSLPKEPVLVYPDSVFHYLFSDTLHIYGPLDKSKIELFYDGIQRTYFIQIDSQRYAIHKGGEGKLQ